MSKVTTAWRKPSLRTLRKPLQPHHGGFLIFSGNCMYLMETVEVYTEEKVKAQNILIKHRKCSKFIAHHYQKHKITMSVCCRVQYSKIFCPIRSPLFEKKGEIYLFHASPPGSGTKMHFRWHKPYLRKQQCALEIKRNMESITLMITTGR